jgi:hypothetical protein
MAKFTAKLVFPTPPFPPVTHRVKGGLLLSVILNPHRKMVVARSLQISA